MDPKLHARALKTRDRILSTYRPSQYRNGFWIGSVACLIRVRRAAIEIRGFHVEDPNARGKGLATRSMKRLLKEFDKGKVPSRLIVTPYLCRKSIKQIREWYEQFGFRLIPGYENVMRREVGERYRRGKRDR